MKIIALLMVATLACTTETVAPETGAINIKLTVGPLCPVEPCNKTKEELKQVYESYSFVISNPKTKSVVVEQKVTLNDTYGAMKNTNIAVGEYELDIKPQNIFTKRDFPKTIKIEKDKTLSLVIEVDTGIR